MSKYYSKHTHYGYILCDKYGKIMYDKNGYMMYKHIVYDKEKNIISDPVWPANCELLGNMMLSDEYLTYDDVIDKLIYSSMRSKSMSKSFLNYKLTYG